MFDWAKTHPVQKMPFVCDLLDFSGDRPPSMEGLSGFLLSNKEPKDLTLKHQLEHHLNTFSRHHIQVFCAISIDNGILSLSYRATDIALLSCLLESGSNGLKQWLPPLCLSESLQ